MSGFRARLALLPILFLLACGGDDTENNNTCTGPDCGDTIADATVTDSVSDVSNDVPSDGSKEISDAGIDLPDFAGSETITDLVPDGPVEGGFGWPCEGPTDCDSGYCIDTIYGPVCTVACVEECPEEGWRCELFSGMGLDNVFLCLPPRTALCRPCTADSDCELVDGEEAYCVSYGDIGRFCGVACDANAESSCTEGYTCTTADGISGEHNVCVSQYNDCPCLPAFVGLSTECLNSNELGTCHGLRTCNKVDSGYDWSTCTAPLPVEETCNSVDDDCNGTVDDGLGETVCGQGVCEHVVAACTEGQTGVCDPFAGSSQEKCNGLDDDCDGETDETWPDKGVACDGPDTDLCANGQLACSEDGEGLICVSDDENFMEECNQQDDDCDGEIDEAADLGELTCGEGICEHTEPACQNGEWIECDPMLGAQPTDMPDMEYVDTNCDGVDGEAADSIFVDVVTGADSNVGTREAPLKTINAALASAQADGKHNLLISLGVYPETVVLVSGISILGGYDAASGWSRSGDFVTQIQGGTTAVVANNITQKTYLQALQILSTAATTPGTSSYGVFVTGGDGLELDNVTVQSGSGAGGQSGNYGNPGLNGSGGSSGQGGCQYGCYSMSEQFTCGNCIGLEVCGNCGRPDGGNGGASPCGATGGDGGLGGPSDSTGESGDAGLGSGAGQGGFGGTKTNDGYPGTQGSSGNQGSHGGGGINVGLVSAGGYQPANGTGGINGSHGGGGGGGGAGGGKQFSWPSCCKVYGSAGGGGGGGGCGGTAGTGGDGGGGSFGIYIVSGAMAMSKCTIKTSMGGTGGNGGNGGEGGDGGDAGLGGPQGDDDNQGLGAAGAPGGNGGNGGNGGGGGGGPSVGIMCAPGTTVVREETTFQLGQPGQGGYSLSNPGQTGLQAEVHGCQ